VSTVIEDNKVRIKMGLVRIRDRGQITIPQEARDRLNLSEGDMLTFLQVDDIILLTPRQPQVPQLADKIVEVMEKQDVSLADLLEGLDQEREAIWRERRKNT
jgi:AbrB family looped-hinge helix DNA binding protein